MLQWSIRISHFTGSSVPTDPWNTATVYDTGLVNTKALNDLPERYDPNWQISILLRLRASYQISIQYNSTVKKKKKFTMQDLSRIKDGHNK